VSTIYVSRGVLVSWKEGGKRSFDDIWISANRMACIAIVLASAMEALIASWRLVKCFHKFIVCYGIKLVHDVEHSTDMRNGTAEAKDPVK
jgi:hypothetical protein